MFGIWEIHFDIVKQACLLAPVESLGVEMCICMDSGRSLSTGAKRHACFTILKVIPNIPNISQKSSFLSFQDKHIYFENTFI